MANKVGSAGRFGPRYGKTIRQKVSRIEARMRSTHGCPYCLTRKVKRVFVGVWKCHKCQAKFAGRAYVPSERR